MGKLINIDFNKKLPFDSGQWTISPWPLNSQYVGLLSNSISHNQSTSFEITGKFEYIRIEFIIKGESNWDLFTITSTKREKFYTSKGCVQNQPIVFEQHFDGTERTLIFAYEKDGSGSVAPDRVCIFKMQVQTTDDSVRQTDYRYALQCNDGIYTYNSEKSLIKVCDNLEGMTKELWQSCTSSMDLYNIRNSITGSNPVALKYTDNINEEPLSFDTKCILMPSIIYTTRSYTFDLEYIKGLKNFEIAYTAGEHDVLLFAFSIDDGETWITYKQGQWQTLPSLSCDNLTVQGMDASEVVNLSEQALEHLYTNKKLKIAFIMKPSSLNSELKLNNYKCNYIL